MSVLTELIIPASEFVLADTLTAAPDMRIEIKRVVASVERVTPYFWAVGGDFGVFEQALRDDPTIQDVLTLEDQQNDERFYRVTWQTTEPNLITAISESEGAVLEAVSSGSEEWELKVLFPTRETLSAFHDYCLEHGFQFELERVYRPENPQEKGEYGVTDEQQEALEAAYRAGYFKVPRDVSLTELADDLDISRNALSARLRRGQHNLLANTLIHED
ncbi:helix-turn-helix domain-containing protein [Halorussus sp. AFM4]|uniref:helix-turn-helix domain-containing protein n=1 Tax=Halorussus sp. AFM4 TaxID=3421651 RepID=UPI003EBF2C0A